MAKRRKIELSEDEKLVERDYVMARAGAALAALASAKQDIEQALALFITPSEDTKGKERKECIDSAIESASIATRCMEDAMDHIDDADFEVGEPWEEEDDDEDAAS